MSTTKTVFNKIKNKMASKYTYQVCKDLSIGCENANQLRKKNRAAHAQAERKGWLADFFGPPVIYPSVIDSEVWAAADQCQSLAEYRVKFARCYRYSCKNPKLHKQIVSKFAKIELHKKLCRIRDLIKCYSNSSGFRIENNSEYNWLLRNGLKSELDHLPKKIKNPRSISRSVKLIRECKSRTEFISKYYADFLFIRDNDPDLLDFLLPSQKYNWSKSKWCESAGDVGYFYIFECFHEEDSFYKLGRTIDIDARYANKSGYPFDMELVYCLFGPPEMIWNLENTVKLNITSYRPSIDFAGKSECFLCFDEFLDVMESKIYLLPVV